MSSRSRDLESTKETAHATAPEEQQRMRELAKRNLVICGPGLSCSYSGTPKRMQQCLTR